jgi:methionyl-tRNA formyltransferase
VTLLRLPDRRLRLAFFGTPDIARDVLAALLDAGADDVALVVCQPDKPKGRGKQVEAPTVKQLAEARGLPVLQPVKLRDGALRDHLRAERIDLAIVIAYGRILPPDLLEAPTFGCWNLHASLLPRHRGASPIQHAILHGDAESGVTLMQMDAGLDTGPMLLDVRFALAADETTPTLTDKMAAAGGALALDGLRRAKAEGLHVTPQDDAAHTLAPIIDKEAGFLDLHAPAAALERRVRALTPWPGTWVTVAGEPLKILRAAVGPARTDALAPGVVVARDAKTLGLACGEGSTLDVLEVLPAGKRPMPAGDYLRGGGRALVAGARVGHAGDAR